MLTYLVSMQLSDHILPIIVNWKSSDLEDGLNKSSGNVAYCFFAILATLFCFLTFCFR